MMTLPLRTRLLMTAGLVAVLLAACERVPEPAPGATSPAASGEPGYAERHAGDYAVVPLEADLSAFDDDGKRMIALLVRASQVMDDLFWQQSWSGDREALLARAPDEATRELIRINFGPWDRLNEDTPLLEGIGPRPPGGMFYPAEMTADEFEAAEPDDKASWYTLLRTDDSGALVTVPYHVAYADGLQRAAALLREAADASAHAGFADYLRMRAEALLTDEFQASDMAWMDLRDNPVDVVIGPIESYEDQLFGYKTAYEGLVLLKDMAWSERLERFAAFLPDLQRGLPVPDAYKAQMPGSDADLNAYTAVYYGGNANVGAKTIAINLPNDEQVQLAKGTRRLQLQNVMRAKFDRIMLPIANELIVEDQLDNVTFDAFFQNTMFHEVAHGLGIKNVLGGDGRPSDVTVSEALKDYASSFEEGKADVLGLYMIDALASRGEMDAGKLEDNYVTFLAGILRSVRFGGTDAHARANMLRFNYFADRGAFVRDRASGKYRVDVERMRAAADKLASTLLLIQGDGDYADAKRMTESLGVVEPDLAADLERLQDAGIPIDIRFEQGLDVLGLEAYAASGVEDADPDDAGATAD